MSSESENEFTTIALTHEDKERLNMVNSAVFNGEASYRKVILYLCDEHEPTEERVARL